MKTAVSDKRPNALAGHILSALGAGIVSGLAVWLLTGKWSTAVATGIGGAIGMAIYRITRRK